MNEFHHSDMDKYEKKFALCIVGLVIHGFGIAGLMVPTFIDSICSAIAGGFPDDLPTYRVICGLWSSSFALGAFVGPSVSGYLFDVVGFEYGSFFVMSIHLLLILPPDNSTYQRHQLINTYGNKNRHQNATLTGYSSKIALMFIQCLQILPLDVSTFRAVNK